MITPQLHWEGGLGSTLLKLLCVLRMIPVDEFGALRRIHCVVQTCGKLPDFEGQGRLVFFTVPERV